MFQTYRRVRLALRQLFGGVTGQLVGLEEQREYTKASSSESFICSPTCSSFLQTTESSGPVSRMFPQSQELAHRNSKSEPCHKACSKASLPAALLGTRDPYFYS